MTRTGDIEHLITLCIPDIGELEDTPAQFDIEDYGLKFIGLYLGALWITPAMFSQMVGEDEMDRQVSIANRWWADEGEREYRRGIVSRMAAE